MTAPPSAAPSRGELAALIQQVVEDAGGVSVSQPLAERLAQHLDAIYADLERLARLDEQIEYSMRATLRLIDGSSSLMADADDVTSTSPTGGPDAASV